MLSQPTWRRKRRAHLTRKPGNEERPAGQGYARFPERYAAVSRLQRGLALLILHVCQLRPLSPCSSLLSLRIPFKSPPTRPFVCSCCAFDHTLCFCVTASFPPTCRLSAPSPGGAILPACITTNPRFHTRYANVSFLDLSSWESRSYFALLFSSDTLATCHPNTTTTIVQANRNRPSNLITRNLSPDTSKRNQSGTSRCQRRPKAGKDMRGNRIPAMSLF